jgi:Inner membrane protein YgaP-like, transmembrane domain
MLEKNESTADRTARTVLGGGLLVASFASLGVTSAKPLGILSALIGAVLLFTAATGSCLLYRLVGANTAKQHS